MTALGGLADREPPRRVVDVGTHLLAAAGGVRMCDVEGAVGAELQDESRLAINRRGMGPLE
jgi:hypothetical protein